MKNISLETLNKLLMELDGNEAVLTKAKPDDEHFTVGVFSDGCNSISGEGVSGVTALHCGYISGPTLWRNCQIRCRQKTFTNKFWSNEKEIFGYELFDEKANFSMHCYGAIKLGNPKCILPERT